MNELAKTLVTLTSAGMSAEIDPLGAQLHALRDGQGRDLLWDGDPGVWTGRAPILFPIVGMLNHGRYHLDGATWSLPKHGFARHSRFFVAEARAAAARFRLQADAATRAVYPFDFTLDVAFSLADAALTMTATVTNPGPTPLPASFGFHPALRWPLPYGRERADHRLRFADEELAPIRRVNSEGLLRAAPEATPVEGRDLALSDDLFVDDALIFDRLASRSLCYGAGDGPQLEVAFPDTALLGVWTKPGAGYICIEPWHGIADPAGFEGDFRSKPGIFEVAPGETKAMSMSITLRS